MNIRNLCTYFKSLVILVVTLFWLIVMTSAAQAHESKIDSIVEDFNEFFDSSEPPKLHFGQFSQHLNGRDGRNQTHNTIGIEYKDVIITTFSNSYYERSYYIGYNQRAAFGTYFNSSMSLGYTVGVIGGYVGVNKIPIPVILPTASFEFGKFGTDLSYIFFENVITISFRYEVG